MKKTFRIFRGGRNPDRVHIIGHNEWCGQSGIVHGYKPAHGTRFAQYQRIVVTVELDKTGDCVGFFIGELAPDNPLERLANLEEE